MKTFYRFALVTSLLLVSAALIAVVFSRYWSTAPTGQAQKMSAQQSGLPAGLVDEQPLLTAEALAPLAVTREEQDFAQEALRLADHEVDLTFTSTLREVTQHPAPLSPAAQKLFARVQELQSQVKSQQDDINHLKSQLAKAADKQKQSIDEDLQLQQALLEVAQEELDGAQQELIRAGGDQKSIIQRLQDQHEAWHQRQGGGPGAGSPTAATSSTAAIEVPGSKSVVAQGHAWLQLNAKNEQLQRARDELKARVADLSRQRQALENRDKNPPLPRKPETLPARMQMQARDLRVSFPL